jgi:hypothetical protein
VRERQRRRRTVAAVVVALLLLAVPVTLAVVSSVTQDDAPADDPVASDGDDAATDDGADAGEDAGPDGNDPDPDVAPAPQPMPEPPAPVVPPDLDVLAGVDAIYGQLLLDIDASENVMLGFQDDLIGIFGGSNGARAADEAVVVAARRRDELLAVRDRLDVPLADGSAEEVRVVYIEHLDSWARYMDAVAEDPAVLAPEGPGASYSLDINTTADAFARELEDALPADIDPLVRDYADAILDRGFRGFGSSDV